MKELFDERRLIKNYLRVIKISKLLSIVDSTREIGEDGLDKTTLMWHLMQQRVYRGHKFGKLIPKNIDNVIEGCIHDGFLIEKNGFLTISTEGRRLLNWSNFLELILNKFSRVWSVLVATIMSPILWSYIKTFLNL